MVPALEIRVLGEIEIVRAGKAIPLPASKKTRALLGYLVVVRGRPQPRQRLCELLWDGPEDPRAALRWSLTKIRPLVDHVGAGRLVADREHVAFEPHGATIDVASVGTLAADMTRAPLEALRAVASLYRGELLEGLDLPECYRYHEWCVAEREAARKARASLLETLVERLAPKPEAALVYARARVAIDPLAEVAHIAVMRLLDELGRPREALKQYESCRRILDSQLGRAPSRELEAARSSLGRAWASGPPESIEPIEPKKTAAEVRWPLVGRAAERAAIGSALSAAAAGVARSVLLFCGEPGIGKTRLLEATAEEALALDGEALRGRAFEAEMVRPYGPWIDALRALAPEAAHGKLSSDLAPLLPGIAKAQGETDRNRLFAAVEGVLVDRVTPRVSEGAKEPRGPLVVALDDVQWFDEASVALLHYLARRMARSRVLIACAARPAELDGNPRARALFRALERDGALVRVDLAPLDRAETEALVSAVDKRVDAAKVFAEGGGNPLYSLELARSAVDTPAAATTHSIDALICERLSRIGERAAEVLPWAAALGRAFSTESLSAITSLHPCELLSALEQLEGHGILRATEATGAKGPTGATEATAAAAGGADYDFAHDLVRQAAYRSMSEPRRRWVHLHVARTLARFPDPEGAIAADVAHHAALGGDNELAARACVLAGERCLRLLAPADASRLASSGLQHAERLPLESALRLRLELLSVQVHSNQWLRRPQALEGELLRFAEAARRRAMAGEEARALYLLSFVHHERGDVARTRAMTLDAAQASRAADVATRQRQLANTGRCLAGIERDVERAHEFLAEAEALGPLMGRAALEAVLGRGLVCAFAGRDDEAVPLIERAAALAEQESDHLLAAQALTRAARLAFERGRPHDALERVRALDPVLAKLSEGSEGPFARALDALSRLALHEDGALAAVERALETLRSVDSKTHVAYVLNALAEHDAQSGHAGRARARAEEALALAETVGHKSEAAVARARVAAIAWGEGDREAAVASLRACASDWASPLALSARARAALSEAAARAGLPM